MRDCFRYLLERRAWWLLPVVVGVLIVLVLGVLTASKPIAPFIYPLF